MTLEEQYRLNDEAARLPQPGDWWHEMFSFHSFVVKVTPRLVWTISGSGDFRNTSEVEVFSWDQFNAHLRYGGLRSPTSSPPNYKTPHPYKPTEDINDIANKFTMDLKKRGEDVTGWLEEALELQRPYIEYTRP